MSSLDIVKSNKKTIAIIIRNNIAVKGVKFFSPKDYPFQIGFHNRPEKTVLKPHKHPAHNFFIKSSQEVLYILRGKIRVDLYDNGNKKKLLCRKTLKDGDSILFVSGGHGVTFLKDSKIFEVKQGPYVGDDKAKIFI